MLNIKYQKIFKITRKNRKQFLQFYLHLWQSELVLAFYAMFLAVESIGKISKSLIVVGTSGFEPETFRTSSERSNQLSYAPLLSKNTISTKLGN